MIINVASWISFIVDAHYKITNEDSELCSKQFSSLFNIALGLILVLETLSSVTLFEYSRRIQQTYFLNKKQQYIIGTLLAFGSFVTEICAVLCMAVVTYCVDLENIVAFFITMSASLIEICIAVSEMIFVKSAR